MEYEKCDETPICKKLGFNYLTMSENVVFINIIVMFISRMQKLFKVTADGQIEEYKYKKVDSKKVNISSEQLAARFDIADYVAQRDKIRIDVSLYKSAVLYEQDGTIYLNVRMSNVETIQTIINPKYISEFIAILLNHTFPVVLTVIKSALTNNVMEESAKFLKTMHTVVVREQEEKFEEGVDASHLKIESRIAIAAAFPTIYFTPNVLFCSRSSKLVEKIVCDISGDVHKYSYDTTV